MQRRRAVVTLPVRGLRRAARRLRLLTGHRGGTAPDSCAGALRRRSAASGGGKLTGFIWAVMVGRLEPKRAAFFRVVSLWHHPDITQARLLVL